MKTLHYILTIILIGSSMTVRADLIGYNDTLLLRIESENFTVIHYHDWSESTRESRYKMISTNQDPFCSDNDYAYLMCINKENGDTIFKKPCPALTQIEISKDEKYIVGISKIKLWNPYQLVIYNIMGELIKSRNFSTTEAKLGTSDLVYFKSQYPKQAHYLDSLRQIYLVSDTAYVDCFHMGMPDKLGEAYEYLGNFYSKNHLSANFRESITNWIFWYSEESPDIKYNSFDSVLLSISILDPKKQRIEIKINE